MWRSRRHTSHQRALRGICEEFDTPGVNKFRLPGASGSAVGTNSRAFARKTNIMKRIPVAVMAIALTRQLDAQTVSSDHISSIFESVALRDFLGLTSISFRGAKIARLGPAFGPDAVPRELPATMHFTAAGRKFSLDIDLTSLGGGSDQSSLIAFDGTRFQRFYKNSRRLELAQGDRSESGILAYNNLLWLPFMPFLPQSRAESSYVVRLADLQDLSMWRNLAGECIDARETQAEGYKCVQITLPGPVSKITGGPTSFELSLAVELGYFPISWKQLNSEGRTVLSYRVIEVGKTSSGSLRQLLFAKKAFSVAYDHADPSRVLTEMEGTVSEVVLNEVIHEDAFMIDPEKASLIYDADADTVIQIPSN